MTEQGGVSYMDGILRISLMAKKLRSGAFEAANVETGEELELPMGEYEVVRTKRFTLRPMSVEEAILQMNMLGHSFFVFLNGDTSETNIVYRRANDTYGVLEPTTK